MDLTAGFIRPLDTKALFSTALNLYRRNFWPLFLINSIYAVVTLLAQLPVNAAVLAHPAGQAVLNWVSILAQLFVIAATVSAASSAVLGRPVSVRAALRRAASLTTLLELLVLSIPALLWSRLYGVLLDTIYNLFGRVSQGTLTALQASTTGILLAVGLLLVRLALDIILLFGPPVAVLEKRGPLGTVRRVVELFSANAGRVVINYGLLWALPLTLLFWILYFPIALTMILLSLASTGLSVENIYAVGLGVGQNTAFIIYALINLFLNPITSLLFTLLYYDTRARKEAYQDELLAEEMGYQPITELMTA